MKSFFQPPTLENVEDVLHFFLHAIEYRGSHKSESQKIARFVFDATYQAKIEMPFSQGLERIRYEFGALEAPGQPDDDGDPDVFVDQLWDRLRLIIEKISNEKGTV